MLARIVLCTAGLMLALTTFRPSAAQDTSPKLLKSPFTKDQADKARSEWAKFLQMPERKTLDLGGGVKMPFVLIPPGTFPMASPLTQKEAIEARENQHEVEVPRAFYLATTETTQAQYKAVTTRSPSHFKGDSLPVEKVSWHDATAFCDNLGKQTGAKGTLPTEAQWEYACRAGTLTAFHFGDVLNGDKANCNGKHCPVGTETAGPYLEKTTPAGDIRYPPNAFGLSDMHGNVWEWCLDGPRKDPGAGQQPEPDRVVRGGSWDNVPWNCMSSTRIPCPPDHSTFIIGFRVALLP